MPRSDMGFEPFLRKMQAVHLPEIVIRDFRRHPRAPRTFPSRENHQ